MAPKTRKCWHNIKVQELGIVLPPLELHYDFRREKNGSSVTEPATDLVIEREFFVFQHQPGFMYHARTTSNGVLKDWHNMALQQPIQDGDGLDSFFKRLNGFMAGRFAGHWSTVPWKRYKKNPCGTPGTEIHFKLFATKGDTRYTEHVTYKD